jgi:hypothetical protein
MQKEFNKDIKVLKKLNWNFGNEKLNKSNKNLLVKASTEDWIKWKTMSVLEDKVDKLKT